MFVLNDDLSIYATRGDIVFFSVSAQDDGKPYKFQAGDVLRIKVYGKKKAEDVVLEKDFPVTEETEQVEIFLTEDDTNIGGVISKPKDYWYEVELNPLTNPQTIIGYDEDGAKLFRLLPEGADIPPHEPIKPEDIPVLDDELDMTSDRPVQNQAIARAVTSLRAAFDETKKDITTKSDDAARAVAEADKAIAVEKARIDNLIAHGTGTKVSKNLDYLEAISEETKAKIDGHVSSDGVYGTIKVNWREANQIYGGTSVDMFVIPSECRPIGTGLIHTEDGLEYRINYHSINKRYYMSIKAKSDVAVAPSGAGTVTFSYELGDHELIDVRVSADGRTYKSAGAAVRGQFEDVKKQLVYGSVFLNNDPSCAFTAETSVEVTLPGNVEIICNGKTYQATDLSARFEFTNSYTLFNVLFNLETKELSLDYFRNAVPDNTAIIGYAFANMLHLNLAGQNHWATNLIDGYNPVDVQVWAASMPTFDFVSTGTGNKVVVNMPVLTINTGYVRYETTARTIECEANAGGLYNILYNRVTDDMVIENRGKAMRVGYQRFGIVNTTYGVYLNGGTYLTNTHNLALAPLILGSGNTFVEFDSVNKVITFPNDTLIQANKTFYKIRHYQLSAAKENNTVSYADMTTSAMVVYYDTRTDKLGVCIYNQNLTDDKIAIASFRTYNGAVSINAPYKWDGKPFNMDAEDLGIEVPDNLAHVNFKVKAVNHRGYCTKAPENTLSAYRLSAKNKFEYVECDISFTSDGVPVLLHDGTIDRTSNGTGAISGMTLAEARKYDYGSWFSEAFAGEQIPTAEEFIALCRKLALHPYIELKGGSEAQIKSLVNIVKKYGMLRNVTWISFNATCLRSVKAADASARLGFVVNSITADDVATAKGLCNDTNEVFIDSGTSDNISLCIEANIPVERWTVNSNNAVLALDPYISGVTSDNVHAGRVLYNAEIGK